MSANHELTPPGDSKEKVSDIVIRMGVLALLVIPVVWAIIIFEKPRAQYVHTADMKIV